MEKKKITPVVLKERELKYSGAILNVYQDTVLVNGHEAKWDFIKHNGAAAVLPVADDGRILMVRQYRHALGRETLEIPAGKLDYVGESPIACAARELEEETGFRSDHLEFLMMVNTTIAFCDERIDIYVARDLIPSRQHLDEDEEVYVETWALEDLEQMIYEGKLTDSKTVASILAYARKYR